MKFLKTAPVILFIVAACSDSPDGRLPAEPQIGSQAPVVTELANGHRRIETVMGTMDIEMREDGSIVGLMVTSDERGGAKLHHSVIRFPAERLTVITYVEDGALVEIKRFDDGRASKKSSRLALAASRHSLSGNQCPVSWADQAETLTSVRARPMSAACEITVSQQTWDGGGDGVGDGGSVGPPCCQNEADALLTAQIGYWTAFIALAGCLGGAYSLRGRGCHVFSGYSGSEPIRNAV